MILLSKKDLHAYLDLHEDKLIAIAHKIWGNPEVGFGEHFAAKLQMDVLKDAGFRIKNESLLHLWDFVIDKTYILSRIFVLP